MGRSDAMEGGFTSLLAVLKACDEKDLRMDVHLTNHYQLHLQAATDEARIPYAEDFFWYPNPVCTPREPPQVDAQGCFTVSVGGIAFDGPYNTSGAIVETERRMIERADRAVVLADQSKLIECVDAGPQTTRSVCLGWKCKVFLLPNG